MEIVLIRHGKPTAAIYPRVSAAEFTNWVRNYNHSGIDSDSFPDAKILKNYRNHYIVSSDLKRAIESAQICFPHMSASINNIFRELEIPRYKLPFTLKASHWLYLNRILWTCGFKGAFESFSAAKKRAQVASKQLITLAEQHNKVVVVSHGYINFYIRKNLLQMGWDLKEKSNQYWGVTRLTI